MIYWRVPPPERWIQPLWSVFSPSSAYCSFWDVVLHLDQGNLYDLCHPQYVHIILWTVLY